MSGADETGGQFRILFLCTGNVCRSPAAERLLTQRIGTDDTLLVGSAGTRALVGAPIAPPMATLLEAHGAKTEGFCGRQASVDLIATADLVLGMSRAHRDWAVEKHPRAVRRAFTLAEFAGCATEFGRSKGRGLGAGRHELVSWAASHRGGPGRDIADPYLRDPRAYREAFERIRQLIEATAEVLG